MRGFLTLLSLIAFEMVEKASREEGAKALSGPGAPPEGHAGEARSREEDLDG